VITKLTGEMFPQLTSLWPHVLALNSGGQTRLTDRNNELPSRLLECFRFFTLADLGLYGVMVVYLPSYFLFPRFNLKRNAKIFTLEAEHSVFFFLLPHMPAKNLA
jgi:hypothetical protein